MTYEEAKEELAKHSILYSHWRHVKTGKVVFVTGKGMIEATLSPVVIYEEKGNRLISWVRPLAEFLDGRFEKVKE